MKPKLLNLKKDKWKVKLLINQVKWKELINKQKKWKNNCKNYKNLKQEL